MNSFSCRLRILLAGSMAVLGAGALYPSCKEEVDPYVALDELSRLSAYQQVHYPNAQNADEGVFYQVFRKAEAGNEVKDGHWIAFDFTVYDLNGMLLQTTHRAIAKDNSMAGVRSNFRPRMRRNIAPFWGTALNRVLSQLHVGDSVIIGVPSAIGSRIKLWSQPTRQSVMLHITIRHSAKNAKQYENGQIRAFLDKHDGFRARDTVFRKVISGGTGEAITEKSNLALRYSGYFLDGVLFDTNDISLALEHGVYDGKREYGLLFVKAKDDAKAIRGYSNAFEGLKEGCRIQLLVLSDVGYKERGSGAIQPHEPLLFDLEVVSLRP